ncbi:hypothetical protein BDP27DRAFT_1471999, partial [Rhodocollybia butyracea]
FATLEPSLSLPDPALLALHATCAKVAHLSGAGEYIDRTGYPKPVKRPGISFVKKL